MNWIRRLFKDEDGAVVVIVALALVVLLGCMALVVDAGVMYVNRSNMQNVADAAALAGAQDLPNKVNAEATAFFYAAQNGVPDPVVNTPYKGNSRKIEVTCTRTVPYMFARVIGFEDAVVSARSVAARSLGGAFDYAIFQGDDDGILKLDNYLEVTGSVHSNDEVKLNGSVHIIEGALEAVSPDPIPVKGSDDIDEVVPGASYVPMPDLTGLLSDASTVITGYETWDYDGRSVDGNIFVDGNVKIAEGSGFTGVGCIYATGNIEFNGSGVTMPPGNSVALYTQHGNITLNGSGGTIYGTFYAPEGEITFDGGDTTVYGRIIANKVTLNGSGQKVISSGNDLDGLPGGYVTLIE